MSLGDDKSGGFGFSAAHAKQFSTAFERIADIWDKVTKKAHADEKKRKVAREAAKRKAALEAAKERKGRGGARKSRKGP